MISGALRGIKGTFSLSALLVEVVTSWVALGALLGALAAGELADQIGRKQTGLIAGAMFTLGALVQALAPDTFLLVAGWLIIGAAVGVAAVAAPLYAAELAPTTLRGRFVSAYQLAITIGIFLAYLIDGWLSDRDAWRTMLGVAAVPGLLLFAVALVAPRSPRWLMKMGAAPMRPSTTRSSPTSPLPTYSAPPMPDAVDGPGIPARRDGCLGPASSGSLGSVSRKRHYSSILAYQEHGRGFGIAFRYKSRRYDVQVGEPGRRLPRYQPRGARRCDAGWRSGTDPSGRRRRDPPRTRRPRMTRPAPRSENRT